jgi:hypothetical protein
MKSEKSDYILKYQQLAQKYDLVVKQISEFQKKESSYLDKIK